MNLPTGLNVLLVAFPCDETAVDGRVNSDFLETTFPPTNVVVVTLATGVALVVALRVRLLADAVLTDAVAVGIR